MESCCAFSHVKTETVSERSNKERVKWSERVFYVWEIVWGGSYSTQLCLLKERLNTFLWHHVPPQAPNPNRSFLSLLLFLSYNSSLPPYHTSLFNVCHSPPSLSAAVAPQTTTTDKIKGVLLQNSKYALKSFYYLMFWDANFILTLVRILWLTNVQVNFMFIYE